MSQPRVALVTADTGNLDELLARVRDAGRGGAPVALLAPPESSLFLTVREFQLLRETIDRDRLHLRFFTDDPLRARLAGLHGIEPAKIPASLHAARPTRPAPASAVPLSGADAAGVAQGDRNQRTPDARSGPRTAQSAPVSALPDRDPRSRPAPFAQPPPASSRMNDAAGGTATARPVPPVAATNPGRVGAGAGTGGKPVTTRQNDLQRSGGASPVAPGLAATPPRTVARPNSAIDGDQLDADAVEGAANLPVPGRAVDDSIKSAVTPESPAETGENRPAGQWPAEPGIPVAPEPLPAPSKKTRFGRTRLVPALVPGEDNVVAGSPEAADGAVDADSLAKPLSIASASERKRSLPRWLGLGLLIAVAAGLGLFAFQALTPRAEIRLTLARQAVQQTVMFDVTADGKPLDGSAAAAVAARTVEFPVVFSASKPVTGTRLDPVGTASGTVRFANPTSAEITVPAGTVLTNGAGVQFLLDAPVTVPPADAATGASGQETGQLTAGIAGGAGDTEAGDIGGRLDSGVYYSNRDSGTTGGEDREVPVVAEADLTALKDQATTTITASAAAEAAKQVPAGDRIIPESVSVVARSDEADAAVGNPVETVTMKSTATIRVLVYDPAEAMLDLRNKLPALLASSAPAGYAIDPATIRFGTEAPVSGQAAGARVEVPVACEAVAVMDEARKQALAEKLAGLPAAEAEQLLQSEPDVAGVDVQYSPDWLTRGMPGDPARITIASGS